MIEKKAKIKLSFTITLLIVIFINPFLSSSLVSGNSIGDRDKMLNISEDSMLSSELIQNIADLGQDESKEPIYDQNIRENEDSSKIEASLFEKIRNHASNTKTSSSTIKLQADFVDILISFDDNVSPAYREREIENIFTNFEIKYNYEIIPCVSLKVDIAELNLKLDNLLDLEEITWVSTNHIQKLTEPALNSISENYNPTSDWSYPFSYDNWWLEAINLPSDDLTGKGVTLAILDTGISPHPDFYVDGNPSNSRIIKSKNFAEELGIRDPNYVFDDYGHGSHCAGIAGGNGYLSSSKYSGVAPNVNLINAKTSNSTGEFAEDDIIASIEWCVEQGADILSMSFGGGDPTVNSPEIAAINEAVKRGVIVVAAAGNSGPNLFTTGPPASGLNSISVGATDINNHIISFSSVGPTFERHLIPDICAPGVKIISVEAIDSIISIESSFYSSQLETNSEFRYVPLSGTSMSTPMVAGAIALLLEKYPDSTPEAIRNALIIGASKIERPSPEGYGFAQGAGLLNVSASLDYLENIENKFGSVNSQAKLFPRELPYAPFDILKFPGDSQVMNLSLFVANATSVDLVLPTIAGLEIFVEETAFEFSEPGMASISIEIKIPFDATISDKKGYIEVRDHASSTLIDSILINITTKYPKGKIYFESFHGLNDYFPSKTINPAQIQFYHMMHDLSEMNYDVDYVMQNWTAGYDPETMAQAINPQLLSKYDMIILQTPIIPYSEFEIYSLKEFFNGGGSILYLGSKSELISVSSLNSLFDELNCGIEVDKKNLFDYRDYGIYTTAIPKIITEIDKSHPIFSGVEKYPFSYGHSFNVEQIAGNISSYQSLTLAAAYEGKLVDKGNIACLGDYHVFLDSIYNNPYNYGNNSLFLQNLVRYLIPAEEIEIDISIKNRSIRDNSVSLAIKVFNSGTSSTIADLVNSQTINATILYSNSTSIKIPVAYSSQNHIYEANYAFGELDVSNKTHMIVISVKESEEIYSQAIEFYYYQEIIDGYDNITYVINDNSSLSWLDRSLEMPIHFIANLMEDSGECELISGVSPSSTFSNSIALELIEDIDFNGTDYIASVDPSKFVNTGSLISFIDYQNDEGYLDFTPDRYFFRIKNSLPQIDQDKSTIGGVKIADTNEGNFIIPLTGQFNQLYTVNIKAIEDVEYEDKGDEIVVSCAIIPIYTYNGYLHPLYPNNFPNYALKYDNSAEFHSTVIIFPSTLNFSSNTGLVEHSMETNMINFYTILWINVRDSDGGSSEELILFLLYDEIPDLSNNIPIVGMITGLIALLIIMQNKDKFSSKKQNPNVNFYSTYQN